MEKKSRISFVFASLSLIIAGASIISKPARAADVPSANPETTSTGTITLPKPESSSSIKPVLSWKSTNDTGRIYELNSPVGKTSRDKQEFTAGFKTNSGWGTSLTIVETGFTYNAQTDRQVNGINQGDHSITFNHPNWITGDNYKWTGQVRAYFTTSANSQALDQRQYAYYLGTDVTLSPTWSMNNTAVPRLYAQNRGRANLPHYYFEDKTTFTYQMNKNIRLGIAQWTQYENHQTAADGSHLGDGLTVELIPSMDYVYSSNLMFGPRLNIPAYANGTVNGAPRAVATDNMLLELYIEAKL